MDCLKTEAKSFMIVKEFAIFFFPIIFLLAGFSKRKEEIKCN